MISALRAELAALITGALPNFPVHRWLPEDTPELPCAVVGRPALEVDPDAATAVLASTTVTVVGRRYTSDGAQEELDDTCWAVLQAYNFLRGMHTATVQRLNVSNVLPDLVSIAGDEYPCYLCEVQAHLIAC